MLEKRWLHLLQAIVNINTGTGNVKGCNRVRDLLVPAFTDLGLKARVDTVHDGHQVVVFEHPEATKPRLVLVGHIDTVFPETSPFSSFHSDSTRLTGPGVIDMKGGIVLMLDILSSLTRDEELRQVRVILNDDEEIGSIHSATRLKELGLGIPFGLVFEPGLPDEAFVNSESGVLWAELQVIGKAAHAGLEHELGVNAALALAHHLVRLGAWTNYEKERTLNIGTITGGTRPNVVCEAASARIDVRYTDPADFADIENILSQIDKAPSLRNQAGEAAKTQVSTLVHVPSFTQGSAEALLPFLRAAGTKTQQRVACRHVGYTSDANHLAQTGMSLLVGLGPCGGGMHTDHEFMLVESYARRRTLGITLIREILAGRCCD